MREKIPTKERKMSATLILKNKKKEKTSVRIFANGGFVLESFQFLFCLQEDAFERHQAMPIAQRIPLKKWVSDG